MKPKEFVLVALMLAILSAGLILIIGSTNRMLLPMILLSFLLIFFAACIFFARESLKENLVLVSILLVLVALSTTFYLTTLKTYYDVANTDSNELSQIQSQNEYYTSYVAYLNQRIMAYQNQTKIMEDRLAELQKSGQTQTQQNPVVSSQNNTPIIPITTPETTYIPSSNPEYEGNDE